MSVTELLGGDQGFGQLALAEHDSLVLSWHGEPPLDALGTVALEYPDVMVEVAPIDVDPSELRALATSLVTTKGHLGIGASYVENDFSAIVVLVHDHVQDHDALADSLTREVGFPVQVQPGAPVPAVG